MDWAPGRQFDGVLLDAPCSATGTIRRHPDLPHRTDGRRIGELATAQAGMLDRAAALTAPGGQLVFCTCSLFRAEGEDHIQPFLDRNPDFSLAPLDGPDGLGADGILRTRPDLWPDVGGLDGFFAARFVRG